MKDKKTVKTQIINLNCEKCGKEKVSVIERNGGEQKETVLPTTKRCPKCKALYCAKCFSEMKKCYCCGKMIEPPTVKVK